MLIAIFALAGCPGVVADRDGTDFSVIGHYNLLNFEKQLEKHTFTQADQLSTFLVETDYENSIVYTPIDPMPDFFESTILAFAGWPCEIQAVVEEPEKILVQYIEKYRDMPQETNLEYAPPAPEVTIYSIPFSSKPIHFTHQHGTSEHSATQYH